nr:PocR ligand-binding domain-containing protein [uncultured Carboxylicivirga sp.]
MSKILNCEQVAMSSFEATVVFDRNTNKVVYMNNRARQLFNLNEIPLDEIRIRNFCSRADRFNEKSAIELFASINTNYSQKYDWPVRLGNIRWLSAFISIYIENENEFIVVTYRDNTEEKESLMKLDSIIGFRDMLDNLLSYNTIVAADKIPWLIDNSLAMVGNFFHCDRSYVFQYSEDLRLHSNINEWCAHGIEPYINELQNIPSNKFAYLSRHLLNKEIVCLNDVNELPDEAKNEREEFAKEGIQSILLIPFIEGEEVIGFVGLDHVRTSKIWTAVEISNLKLLARAFANMLLRQRKERRIKEQEEMYKTWFMAANDSIAIFKHGVCIDANPKLLKDLNCSRDYLVNKSLVELSATTQSNEKSPTYINVYHQNALEGAPQFFEWILRRQDGSDFEVEISLNRFSDKGTAHTIAIFRDISGHNQLVSNILASDSHDISLEVQKKRLNEGELSILELFDIDQLQKLQDAFSFATGISSLITDTKGNPITKMSFSNEICKKVRSSEEGDKMCQQSGRELGQMAAEQLKPVSKSCSSCGFIDAAAPIIIDGHHLGNWAIGQVRPKELQIENVKKYTRQLGISDQFIEKEFANLVEVTPLQFDRTLKLLNVLSKELSILGYNNLKLAKSIQNHVALEKKLRMAKQKAEESDRLKSAFLANLSHEIRTPMNGIVGFAELLQYEGLTPDDRKEYIRLIHQSSRQLLNIINDIIDISKIESGQIEVHSGFFDLNSVFISLESLFMPNADAKKIKLQFVNDESDEMEVFSDEVKFRQVLTNLISNAIKFTTFGHVEFGYESLENNKVRIFVRDSGVGIDADNVDFIFDRFWQAKDADVKKGGTGLGLAITKAYVELLGGHIHVESKVDEGTEFSFVLPRVLS